MRSQVVVELLRLELEASLERCWRRRADGGGSPEKGNVGSLEENNVLAKTVSDG